MSPLDEAIAELHDRLGDESITDGIRRRVDADIVLDVDRAIAVHRHAIEALEGIRELHLPAALAAGAAAEMARHAAHPPAHEDATDPVIDPACERWFDESAAHPASPEVPA